MHILLNGTYEDLEVYAHNVSMGWDADAYGCTLLHEEAGVAC